MKFLADLEHLPEMLDFIRSFCNQEKLSEPLTYVVELGSEEALVNIICYAFPKRKKKEYIEIECSKQGEHRIAVSFSDRGIAFNPLEHVHDVDTTLSIHQRPIGGLGILFMHKLTSELKYERVGSKNKLTLVFNFGS